MAGIRAIVIWGALAVALAVPVGVALTSPLLQWRDPVYIGAGLAGVVALGLLLVQPLVIGDALPGLSPMRARIVHRFVGLGLVGAVVLHVGGLWIVSPPDVIDALTFTSPTPFAPFGVVAMWAVFAAAAIALARRRLRWRPVLWRRIHGGLAVLIVSGTVLHALLIDGSMGQLSKAGLCVAAVLALAFVLWRRRVFAPRRAAGG